MTSEYTEASELEEEFVAWLAELSKGVRWEYMRTLFDNEKNYMDEDYCPKCVEIQRYVEKHNKTGYTNIDGWDESQEADAERRCARCDVLLHISPTEYMIGDEIEYLSTCDEISEDFAAQMHNWLTHNGNYSGFNRHKFWPLIEPHAKRLLEAAKKASVQP